MKLVVDVGDNGEIANMLELSAGNVMRHRVCSALLVRKRGGAALGRRAKIEDRTTALPKFVKR